MPIEGHSLFRVPVLLSVFSSTFFFLCLLGSFPSSSLLLLLVSLSWIGLFSPSFLAPYSLCSVLGMLPCLVSSFCIPFLFVSILMSSSTMEDESPVRGRSLAAKEVKGTGENKSEDELSISFPSSTSDSKRTKDILVSGGKEAEIRKEAKKTEKSGGSQQMDGVVGSGKGTKSGREQVCPYHHPSVRVGFRGGWLVPYLVINS